MTKGLPSVFIRGVPFSATEEEVRDFFREKIGSAIRAVLIRASSRNNRQASSTSTTTTAPTHRGFGFVKFHLDIDAQRAAQELNGAEFKGRKLMVELAVDNKQHENPMQQQQEQQRGEQKSVERHVERKDAKRKRQEVEQVEQVEQEKDDETSKPVSKPVKKKKSSPREEDATTQAVEELPQKKKKKKKQEKQKQQQSEEEEEQEQTAQEPAAQSEKSTQTHKKRLRREMEDQENEMKDDEAEEEEEEEEEKPLFIEDRIGESKPLSSDRKLTQSQTDDLSTTIFARNIGISVTQSALKSLFSKYGPLKYVAIVKNKSTNVSNGTAFIRFATALGFQKCLQEATEHERLRTLGIDTLNVTKREKKNKRKNIETPEPNPPEGTLDLDGTLIDIFRAKRREELPKRNNEKVKADSRNIQLALEGYVAPDSAEAAKLEPALVERIRNGFRSKRETLAMNPNYHVSRTRLCIRNLPKHWLDADVTAQQRELRRIFLTAAYEVRKEFGRPEIRQVKVLSEQNGKSKGIAFIEFEKHEHALHVLRTLNLNPSYFGFNKMPMVEFSLENAQALQKLHKTQTIGMERSRQKLEQLKHAGGGQMRK